VPTPVPSTPEAVIASMARLVRRLIKSDNLDETVPVGVGLPGVTIDGALRFAGNIDQAWIDFPVVERLGKVLKRPIFIINDADAAGIAEMRFGVGKGRSGTVIFLTLGRASGRASSPTTCWCPTRSSARWRSAGGRPRSAPPRSRASDAGCRGRRGRPISTNISNGSSN